MATAMSMIIAEMKKFPLAATELPQAAEAHMTNLLIGCRTIAAMTMIPAPGVKQNAADDGESRRVKGRTAAEDA